MKESEELERFVEAQRSTYELALGEIKKGEKKGHWMWFIFPQVQGLALSEMSAFYSIKNMEEARAYLKHEILGARLVEISTELLNIDSDKASEIFGYPDNLKLLSCMTLFAAAQTGDSVFEKVLGKFFDGKKDSKTLAIIAEGG